MRSLQLRLTCWIALVSFAIIFVVLLAFNAYAFYGVVRQEKRASKTIARSILRELAAAGNPTDAIPENVIRSIDMKIAFSDPGGRLAYAIVSADFRLLHQTPRFNIPLDEVFLAREHRGLFLHSVKSGSGLDDILSEWRFIYRYSQGDYIVFISDYRSYEMIERFVQGLAMAAALAILLALPSGYLLSRRTLRPIEAIDETVERIQRGELAARIPPVVTNREMAHLVDTLNHTFAELENSFGRIEQFSADAAHELSTPLTALRGNLEVCLRRERKAGEYQAVLAESIDEIRSLSGMVKDLLLLANPNTRDQRETFVPVNGSEIVAETIESLMPRAAAGNIRIAADIQPGVHVPGSAPLLKRLCYNLLNNAIGFSSAGTTVTVTLKENADSLDLTVGDEGPGISESDQDKIFERFYQVDQSRSAGIGLGLPLVKWVVHLHGGSIEVTSELGQGSRFRVTLPKEKPTIWPKVAESGKTDNGGPDRVAEMPAGS